MIFSQHAKLILMAAATAISAGSVWAADPLPSWNETASKRAIIDFVTAVTDESGAGFVAPEDRIATFDNDGTLWVEAPIYTQLIFAIDQIKELAPEHPEWQTTQPFKALLEDDMKTVAESGMSGLMQIVMTSHAGMTEAEFAATVTEWFATTKQDRFDRPYNELIYQPQLELLDYLRDNGFSTYIVSGGGISFMRPMTMQAYGIPPEQVIGSRVATEYKIIDGKPALLRLAEIDFIDDKAGKPVGIMQSIGRRPILAFGNSDGDMQMIEFTTAGDGLRLGLYVHHTDAEREYAYDRDGHVGVLDKAWDRAADEGWIIVDMKDDWNTIFPEN
ncbi:MAG: haloacid dehalogenase-like hydrolase [Rhodobacteraceae bacterium]|nr:haloacid dehalogenase-like hydrolase [Paracoccaceae bacterium]